MDLTQHRLIYDGTQVVGGEGVDYKTKQPYKKTAKLIVDATGITSTLRNQLQNSTKIERKIEDFKVPKGKQLIARIVLEFAAITGVGVFLLGRYVWDKSQLVFQ